MATGKSLDIPLLGSPFYHAPEILYFHRQLADSYDEKVDVWALGCVVFEMLAGSAPEDVVALQMNLKADMPNVVYYFNMMSVEAGTLRNLAPDYRQERRIEGMEQAVLFLDKCFHLDCGSRASASALMQDAFCKPDPAVSA